jgi:hypothetical protein
MPETITLSTDALALLTLHRSGGSLMVDQHAPESLPGRTVDETRAAVTLPPSRSSGKKHRHGTRFL